MNKALIVNKVNKNNGNKNSALIGSILGSLGLTLEL